jgi:uncharacterized protein (DUF2336 family)
VASTSALLISELDAIDGWAPERWADALRQITKLFLSRGPGIAAEQIALFDDVFVRLIDHVDAPALAQFSQQLCDAKYALPLSFRKLALHDDESVSLPILRSARFSPELILDVVRSGGLRRRVAIALRHTVEPAISEALLRFADPAINHALVANLGASLLEADWARLAQIGESDTALTQKLARRSDLPEALKRKVRARLEDARMRHLNAMPAVMREQIENTTVTAEATRTLTGSEEPDYATAYAQLAEFNRKGKLNDSAINRFAVRGEYTNVVAALSLKTGSPVEVILPLIASDNLEGLVLACKASRLDWATAAAIVKHRPGQSPVAPAELEKAKKTYDEFSLSAAQRTVRF